MTLTSPPSIIIRDLLIANSLGSSRSSDDPEPWPIGVSHEPDSKQEQDDIVTLYDTGGANDGRIMKTGERVQHETVQVRIRSKKYLTGYAQIKIISDFFDQLLRESIIVDSVNYLIQNISRSSPILPLGTEKGSKRRQLFTLNIAVTINEEN